MSSDRKMLVMVKIILDDLRDKGCSCNGRLDTLVKGLSIHLGDDAL